MVSVVIPTRNSASTLVRCLESIRAQTFQALEVLVIDNYSKDETAEIARSFGARFYQKGPERSAQVNFGVTMARGKYVYRPDSDVVLDQDLVDQCVNVCESKNLDGVVIRTTSDATISRWAKLHSFERGNFYEDDSNVAVTFLRKSAFEAIGGYDLALVAAEDFDLHRRFIARGFVYGRVEAGETHLGEERTLAEVARKHYYYGKTINQYFNRNPALASSQMTPVRLFRLVRRKRNELVWWMPILLPVYQLVRYSSIVLGMISTIGTG